MKLSLHFILVNSEFNQGLADDLYNGQETEDNIKYLWEDEFEVSEALKSFKIRNKDIYTLAGYYPDNSQFSFEIWDMTVVDCLTESGKEMQFAVSKSLIKKTEKKTDKNNDTHLYFYLRDTVPMKSPMNGVYIAKKDFPKELLPKKENQPTPEL